MLIYVCALHCEAKPVIDFYRLKKLTATALPFDVYQHESVCCIVSGMGQEKMTRCIRQFSAQRPTPATDCWINLGIAGHHDLPVGTAVLIERAANEDESENLEIDIPQTRLPTAAIISLRRESSRYHQRALYDMEAFAFVKACRQAGIIKHYCIKIISDNSNTRPTRNKATISNMIAQQMPLMTQFIKHLDIAYE